MHQHIIDVVNDNANTIPLRMRHRAVKTNAAYETLDDVACVMVKLIAAFGGVKCGVPLSMYID